MVATTRRKAARTSPAQHDDGVHAVGDSHGLGHADDAVGGDGVGIVNDGVDAARNDPDAVGGDLVLALDDAGHVMAGGDDDLALGHDGIVTALERQVLVINAVVSGNEMRARAPAGKLGGLGRRAGAGVDNGHFLGANNGFEFGRVAPDGDGVLRQQRELEVAAAHFLNGGDQGAARAGHQRHGLRLRDRLGDFDCAALHPARDEGGKDLEDDGGALEQGGGRFGARHDGFVARIGGEWTGRRASRAARRVPVTSTSPAFISGLRTP